MKPLEGDSEDDQFSTRVIPSGTSDCLLELVPQFDIYLEELVEEFMDNFLSFDVNIQDNTMEHPSNANPFIDDPIEDDEIMGDHAASHATIEIQPL